MRPATPVEPTTPPGVTRPCAWVAAFEVEPGRPALGSGETPVRIDRNAAHPREVDHEPVVDRAMPGGIVASTAHRDLEPVRLTEGKRLGH